MTYKYSLSEGLFFCLTGITIVFVLGSLFGIAHLTVISLAFTFYYFYLLFLGYPKSNSSILKYNLVYIGLLLWTIIILIRGWRADGDFISSLFLSQYFFLPFTFPFLIRCFSPADIKRVFSIIYYLNFVYLFFIFFYFLVGFGDESKGISFSEIINKAFAYPSFLLLFSMKLLSKKVRIASVVVFFIGLFISIINARRGMVFTFGAAGLIALVLYFVQTKMSLFKTLSFYIGLVLLCVGAYSFYMNYQTEVFGKLLDKIDLDTRGAAISDFNRDMTSYDFVVGKGIGGTYLLRDFAGLDKAVQSNQRDGIEAGYLDIVLRGGYIYLALLLTIYCIAMYRGFFKSKNVLAKAFAAFILLHVLELYPAGNLSFNVRYLLIWFGIAMCCNNVFLKLTNNQLLGLTKNSTSKVKDNVLL